jgi:hypothetical protein
MYEFRVCAGRLWSMEKKNRKTKKMKKKKGKKIVCVRISIRNRFWLLGFVAYLWICWAGDVAVSEICAIKCGPLDQKDSPKGLETFTMCLEALHAHTIITLAHTHTHIRITMTR